MEGINMKITIKWIGEAHEVDFNGWQRIWENLRVGDKIEIIEVRV